MKHAEIVNKLRAQAQVLSKSDSTAAQSAVAVITEAADALEGEGKADEARGSDVVLLTVDGLTSHVAAEQKLAAEEGGELAQKRLAHLAEQGAAFQKALLEVVKAGTWTPEATFPVKAFKKPEPGLSPAVKELEGALLDHDVEPSVIKSVLEKMGLSSVLLKSVKEVEWPADINADGPTPSAARRVTKASSAEQISFGKDACASA